MKTRSFFAVCCCVRVPEGPLGFPVQFGSLLFLVQPSVLLPSLLPLLHLLGRQPAVSEDAHGQQGSVGLWRRRVSNRRAAHHKWHRPSGDTASTPELLRGTRSHRRSAIASDVIGSATRALPTVISVRPSPACFTASQSVVYY